MGIGYPANRTVANALARALKFARTPDHHKNAQAIVMYSGGLDSVALLAVLLAETDLRVHAHHMHIHNKEARDEPQRASMEAALAYIRANYRDFEFSKSSIDFPIGLGGGTDLQLAMFTAGRLTTALGGKTDIVFTGHINPPFWELSEGASVLNAIFVARKSKPEWVRPFAHLPGNQLARKVAIWESIPEDLANLSFSCRKPVQSADGYSACGTCHACKTRQELATELQRRRAGI